MKIMMAGEDQALRHEFEKRLSDDSAFALARVRLVFLEAYRAAYGAARAEELTRTVAQVLSDSVGKTGYHGDFVGRAGEDEFLIVSRPATIEAAAARAKEVFDWLAASFYSKEDVKRGGVMVTDAAGKPQLQPIVRLAIGAVTLQKRWSRSEQAQAQTTRA